RCHSEQHNPCKLSQNSHQPAARTAINRTAREKHFSSLPTKPTSTPLLGKKKSPPRAPNKWLSLSDRRWVNLSERYSAGNFGDHDGVSEAQSLGLSHQLLASRQILHALGHSPI